MSHRPRPLVLCILDGWGERADRADNAILLAKTPNWHEFLARYPHAHMQASESFVGLPSGQMGNSEVGHMNLGAGRVVMQDLPRIDAAIADGSLARNPALDGFIAKLRKSGGTAHLLGLMSPGGVHSHQSHLAALARRIDEGGVPVAVHAFLDGRDTPPRSALGYLETFAAAIKGHARTHIATIGGRYYAMDRDKRWDRVETAYRALVMGEGPKLPDAKTAIERAYADGKSDEFVRPCIVAAYRGMQDGDGVVMGNYRSVQVREILDALLDHGFDGFARTRVVRFAAAAGLTEYSADLNRFLTTLFPPQELRDTFGEVVSQAGLTQLRIAETEKYAHVTFFFNGGREEEFAGESRILVPSPRVATYDLHPEMSAPEVTDRLVKAIADRSFDVIVVNFANTDMVGHSGDLGATIKAVEAVDRCIGRVAQELIRVGGTILLVGGVDRCIGRVAQELIRVGETRRVTADHGNAEMMRGEAAGQPR